jgi:hypothetical protein
LERIQTVGTWVLLNADRNERVESAVKVLQSWGSEKWIWRCEGVCRVKEVRVEAEVLTRCFMMVLR